MSDSRLRNMADKNSCAYCFAIEGAMHEEGCPGIRVGHVAKRSELTRYGERTFEDKGLKYSQKILYGNPKGSVGGGTVDLLDGSEHLYIRLSHPVGGTVYEASTLVLRRETIEALAKVCEEMLRAGSSEEERTC